MVNSNWNPEPEFTLHVSQGMIVYEDGKEDPLVIFYHKANDARGCELEAKQRREIQAYLETHYFSTRVRDEGDSLKDRIIPVANTTDVLGILKGDVEFSPTYKRLLEITHEELQLNLEFTQNWLALGERRTGGDGRACERAGLAR